MPHKEIVVSVFYLYKLSTFFILLKLRFFVIVSKFNVFKCPSLKLSCFNLVCIHFYAVCVHAVWLWHTFFSLSFKSKSLIDSKINVRPPPYYLILLVCCNLSVYHKIVAFIFSEIITFYLKKEIILLCIKWTRININVCSKPDILYLLCIVAEFILLFFI